MQLSYIFALLALTGVCVPSLHPLSRLTCIISTAAHQANVEAAIQLLLLLQQHRSGTDEETMTRCLSQTVISSYWIQLGKVDQAWYHAELASADAKAMGLYDNKHTDKRTASQPMSPALFYRREMLRCDLVFNGRFSSFLLGKPTSIPDVDSKLQCKPLKRDGTIDDSKAHLLQIKTTGPLLGLQIVEFAKQFDNYVDSNQRVKDALELYTRLDASFKAPSKEFSSLPEVHNVSLNDSQSSLTADRVLCVALTNELLRILLALPFLAQRRQDPTLQRNAFHSARHLLTSFGLM